MRIGQGFDVHKFTENRDLILGGVKIPYKYGLAGHSDADVLVHAIIDSILGAAGKGDIGEIFPDSDNKYKNISSLILLETIYVNFIKNKFKINNLDATIICEKPKIKDYKKLMKKNIAKILNMDEDNINIKGTTTEQLGFTGREEGIAAHCVCLLQNL